MRITQHFMPDSQGTARFSAAPFQKFEISMAGIDRTEPELFPFLEGEYLYCDRGDYPALINLVLPTKGIQISQVFKTGLQIKAPFKGISVSHPLLSSIFGSKYTLSFIIGKVNGVEVSNNLGDAAMPMSIAYRVVSNTALSQVIRLFVPPGARRIRKFFATLATQTTVTQASLQFVDAGGISFIQGSSSISQQVAAAVVTYNGNPFYGSTSLVTTTGPVAGTSYLAASDLVVPTGAVEVDITINGTGLGTLSVLECTFT